jgi:DNA-binding CsgD family transcriptional regulator
MHKFREQKMSDSSQSMMSSSSKEMTAHHHLRQSLPASAPQPHRAQLNTDALAGILDDMDTGVLVCDMRGRLLLANQAACTEMAEGGVLRVAPDGHLDGPSSVGLLALRRALREAALERRHRLLPLRNQDRTLMVTVQPLRSGGTAEPCALVLMGRRSLGTELLVQRLSCLYELTDAEKAVLCGLLNGLRIPALAKQRGVAISTIRTQVATIRAKCGVRRVGDLIRQIAELPPMMGALRQPLIHSPRPALSQHHHAEPGALPEA